jgi:hypothetical protein
MNMLPSASLEIFRIIGISKGLVDNMLNDTLLVPTIYLLGILSLRQIHCWCKFSSRFRVRTKSIF